MHAKIIKSHVPVSAVYLLTYGGGLVDGDAIVIKVTVKSQARLQLLTQASTKVYKRRPMESSHTMPSDFNLKACVCGDLIESPTGCEALPWLSEIVQVTDIAELGVIQQLHAHIEQRAMLCLLPEPVCVFADASFRQTQVIDLDLGTTFHDWASLVLLDWYTSGRKLFGEHWDFFKLESTNEIWYRDCNGSGTLHRSLLLRDCTLLDEHGRSFGSSLSFSGAQYDCYAVIYLIGPLARRQAHDMLKLGASVKIGGFPTTEKMHKLLTSSSDCLWSVSSLDYYSKKVNCGGACWHCLKSPMRISAASQFENECSFGAVVRLAARDVHTARRFLNEIVLVGLDDELSENLFSRCL